MNARQARDDIGGLIGDMNVLNGNLADAAGKATLYNQAISQMNANDTISGQSMAYEQLKGSIDAATNAVNAMPTEKTVVIRADTSGLNSAIEGWRAGMRPVKIAAEFVTRDGKQVY
jgi:hypothetical protein